MKATLKVFRTVFISALWVWLYLNAAHFYYLLFWNFDPFIYKDWQYLYSQWEGGWVIDDLSELIFFVSLLLFIPLLLLGWFLTLKVHWKKIFTRPFASFKEKASIKHRLALDTFPEPEVFARELLARVKENRKNKMPLLPKRTSSASKIAGSDEDKSSSPLRITQKDIDELPKEPEVLPEPLEVSRVELKYALLELAEKYKVRMVQDLKIGPNFVEIALLAKGVVYLVNMEPNGTEWIADEVGFENDAPLWFSETKYEESPVFKLNEAHTLLSSVMEDVIKPTGNTIEIKKLFLVGAGAILNYNDIASVWQENNVEVARLDRGKPEEIAHVEQLFERLSALGDNSQSVTELIYTAFIAVEP